LELPFPSCLDDDVTVSYRYGSIILSSGQASVCILDNEIKIFFDILIWLREQVPQEYNSDRCVAKDNFGLSCYVIRSNDSTEIISCFDGFFRNNFSLVLTNEQTEFLVSAIKTMEGATGVIIKEYGRGGTYGECFTVDFKPKYIKLTTYLMGNQRGVKIDGKYVRRFLNLLQN
jgi:hypothetical protein